MYKLETEYCWNASIGSDVTIINATSFTIDKEKNLWISDGRGLLHCDCEGKLIAKYYKRDRPHQSLGFPE